MPLYRSVSFFKRKHVPYMFQATNWPILTMVLTFARHWHGKWTIAKYFCLENSKTKLTFDLFIFFNFIFVIPRDDEAVVYYGVACHTITDVSSLFHSFFFLMTRILKVSDTIINPRAASILKVRSFYSSRINNTRLIQLNIKSDKRETHSTWG